MIGSRRDNDLANYREDHCQEEQGNGTVHLSMKVKNIVTVFLTVATIMIIMVPTTMTTKRLWGYIQFMAILKETTTMSLDISRHDSL